MKYNLMIMKMDQEKRLEQIVKSLEEIVEKLQIELSTKSGQDNIFKSIVLLNGTIEFLTK